MYSTDPVKDAGDYMDKLFGYSERMEKAILNLELDFVCACFTKDSTDDVEFHDVCDHKTKQIRSAKVWEIMHDALDNEGVSEYVMQTILLCARKGDVDAQSAIRKMAKTFALQYAYVEE